MANDYIPHGEEEFYNWSENYTDQAVLKGPMMNLDPSAYAKLVACRNTYRLRFAEYLLPNHGPGDTTAMHAAKAAYIIEIRAHYMRYIKGNRDLTARDYKDFRLDVPNTLRTKVPVPGNQAQGTCRPLGNGLLQVIIEIIGSAVKDSAAADYGYRVYAGVVDSGADPEAAGKYGRYLPGPPLNGLALSWSTFTRRDREVFEFDAQDRGKTVWFCIVLENAKGDSGPWGPLLSTIIP
ncbi:hypothetical protein FACS1894137_17610 [Spirochaetia bacterium]|nr:hypothetical protein FACS1894137_17610 [Spirochaetia bacterium]